MSSLKPRRYEIGGYSGDQLEHIVIAIIRDADAHWLGRDPLKEVVAELYQRLGLAQDDEAAQMNEMNMQMTDIYGVSIVDVQLVRTFRDGRGLGAGCYLGYPGTWFVYDRENTDAKWHKHCGPYSTFEQASDWIKQISEAA